MIRSSTINYLVQIGHLRDILPKDVECSVNNSGAVLPVFVAGWLEL